MTEDELAVLVTRDSMIGVAVVKPPPEGSGSARPAAINPP
jgi:hypothetical protein